MLPLTAGTAHVILSVEDDGEPSLTAYRRVILTIEDSEVINRIAGNKFTVRRRCGETDLCVGETLPERDENRVGSL